MKPRSEIHSRTYHTKDPACRREWHSSREKGHIRYAQAETGLNYTHLSYKLIQTYIQISHDERKEIEQVSYFLTDDDGKCFYQIRVLMVPKLQK
jgi:hypothetical protein